MLKLRSVVTTTTIIYLASISVTSIQSAKASIASASFKGDNLIHNGEQLTRTKLNQSDLNGIHRALTEFYGGLNQSNIHRMQKGSEMSSEVKTIFNELFKLNKLAHSDISVEVTSISLITSSRSFAVTEIETITRSKDLRGTHEVSGKVAIGLNKRNGTWKIMPDRQEDINKIRELVSSMKSAMGR